MHAKQFKDEVLHCNEDTVGPVIYSVNLGSKLGNLSPENLYFKYVIEVIHRNPFGSVGDVV